MDSMEKIVNEVLRGIDERESDSDAGWWETSIGAEFGAMKKAELLMRLNEDVSPGLITLWNKSSITMAGRLPEQYDEIYLIQVNGRKAGMLRLLKVHTNEELEEAARNLVKDLLNGRPARAVVVPGKLVNFVTE